jgi:predicted MPP superfamily phosphohydrolase
MKTLKKIVVVTLFMLIFLYLENNSIVKSYIEIEHSKMENNNKIKIIHLSDLHCKSFGENQKYIINKIKKEKPDIIAFTGDLIDSRRYNEIPSLELMKELVKISPVYYVTGNHEWRYGNVDYLQNELETLGVKVLRNHKDLIKINNQSIEIIGIEDPLSSYGQDTEANIVESYLMPLIKEDKNFKLLLSHRPEKFNIYNSLNIDLVLTGHAHGGQIRLPIVGGLFAPMQGIFPKYTKGLYREKDSYMIVNRGLGNSLFPQRIFNRPEIVVITLKASENRNN